MTPEEVDRWLDVVERGVGILGDIAEPIVVIAIALVALVLFAGPMIRDVWRAR